MKSSTSLRRERFLQLSQLPVAVRLGRFDAEILYWGFFEPRWWRNFLHTHSFFEICYAYAGQGVFRMLGVDRKVRAGDLFVARPTEPHEIISSRKRPLGIYFWAYTLLPLAAHRTTRPAATGVDALFDAFAASGISISRAPRSIPQTLEHLADEADARRPGYGLAIESLVSKLLLDTARALAPPSLPVEIIDPPATDPAGAVVRTATRYLRDNFARPIGIRDVAAQVHVSERHLSRLFLAATHRSVIDHLIEIRLAAAKQLLLDRDRPIKSIAAEVGYPDVRYFITLFHRHAGTTPARWRATGGTKFLPPNRQNPPKKTPTNAKPADFRK